jgi:hypothetical protein
MKELLQLLLEEAEAEERDHWYSHDYGVEDRALQALQKVIRRAQARLEEEK